MDSVVRDSDRISFSLSHNVCNISCEDWNTGSELVYLKAHAQMSGPGLGGPTD